MNGKKWKRYIVNKNINQAVHGSAAMEVKNLII